MSRTASCRAGDRAHQSFLHQILGLIGVARQHQRVAPQHAEMRLHVEPTANRLIHARYTLEPGY